MPPTALRPQPSPILLASQGIRLVRSIVDGGALTRGIVAAARRDNCGGRCGCECRGGRRGWQAKCGVRARKVGRRGGRDSWGRGRRAGGGGDVVASVPTSSHWAFRDGGVACQPMPDRGVADVWGCDAQAPPVVWGELPPACLEHKAAGNDHFKAGRYEEVPFFFLLLPPPRRLVPVSGQDER